MSQDVNTYFLMGRFFLKEDQFDMAINTFSKAIELDTENPLYYDYRGISRSEKKAYRDSILDFTKAIQIDNKYVGAYCNRGLAYYKLGQLDKAIKDYDKAIELDSETSFFYSNRGLAYYYCSEYFEAITDFNKAIELDPLDFEARDFREEAYANLSKGEKSIVDMADSANNQTSLK